MAPLKTKQAAKRSATDDSPTVKKQKLQNGTAKAHHADSKPVTKSSKTAVPRGAREDEFDGFDSDGGVQQDSSPPSGSPSGEDTPKDGPQAPSRPFKTGQSSAEAHAAQRLRAKERKANKPNADMIMRLNKIGERLRRQSHVPLEERKKLVAELFEIITGNIRDLVFKHDSVRVIQVGLKYANATQRLQIARELQSDYLALAESKYGKFLVAKLIVEGDKEIRSIVIPSFYGHVRRLINHPEAAWILDDIYRQVATSEQKALLLREWYSAEYAIKGKSQLTGVQADDKDIPTADLASILEKSPEKRRTILQYLFQLINQLVQKKLTAFTMLHDAMLQYVLNVGTGTSEHTEFFELLKSDLDDETTKAANSAEKNATVAGGDLLKSLAFTQSGARIVRLAFAYGTAKDRKVLLRVYRDLMVMMANDAHAHTVLLAAMDVIDDTKLSTKAIWSELLGDQGSQKPSDSEEVEAMIIENLVGKYARVVMLYPFAGLTKSLFPGQDRARMDEVYTIRATGTSKKDPEVRRQEILKYISPKLLDLIGNSKDDSTKSDNTLSVLVSQTFGPQAITEIMLEGQGDKSAACNAIADLCRAPPPSTTTRTNTDEVDKSPPHIALSAAGGKMLKSLIQGGKFDPSTSSIRQIDPPLGFADVFYSAVVENLLSWATGPSCSVIAALLESSETSQTVKKEVKKVLGSGKARKALEETAQRAGAVQAGARTEQRPSKQKKAKTGNKDDSKEKTEGGKEGGAVKANAGGLRLLLELLDK